MCRRIAFPVWLLGVGLYHVLRKPAAARGAVFGGIAWCASLALIILYIRMGGARIFTALPFDYALADIKPWGINFWPQSYLVGLLIALNIYGFSRVQHIFRHPTDRCVGLVRKMAETSFGLYLFHYPLMYFCKAVLAVAGIAHGPVYVVTIYVLPLLVATWLSLTFEPLKFVLSTALKKLRGTRPASTRPLADPLAEQDPEERLDS